MNTVISKSVCSTDIAFTIKNFYPNYLHKKKKTVLEKA